MPHIAATILLGGSVRPTPFRSAIQRAVLDLPFDAGRTLLDAWCDHVSEFADAYPGATRLLRVLTDQEGTGPTLHRPSRQVQVHIDRDPTQWRGTGGVLRDMASTYHPEDFLLVANAAQILLQPLPQIVESLLRLKADVAMVAHDDGAPVTLMLVRCACLKELPDIGYIDMKEQALPLIAKKHVVKVVSFDHHVSQGLRTAATYLAGLRSLNQSPAENAADPLEENWRSQFQITEDPASLDPGVRIHDSIVLRGARVGRAAVLIRSLVCPGAVVLPNAILIDQIASAAGLVGSREAAQ